MSNSNTPTEYYSLPALDSDIARENEKPGSPRMSREPEDYAMMVEFIAQEPQNLSPEQIVQQIQIFTGQTPWDVEVLSATFVILRIPQMTSAARQLHRQLLWAGVPAQIFATVAKRETLIEKFQF